MMKIRILPMLLRLTTMRRLRKVGAMLAVFFIVRR